MKYSMRFSDTIHVLAYIAILNNQASMSSAAIAASVETNPANIRRIMAALSKANLIKTTAGKAQPTLAKDPRDISLLDIYQSLDEDNLDLIQVDPKTNPDCVIGGNIQDVLREKYAEIQKTVLNEMKKTTLNDIITSIAKTEVQKRPENRTMVTNFLP